MYDYEPTRINSKRLRNRADSKQNGWTTATISGILALVLLSIPSSAQVDTKNKVGMISGFVIDESKQPVPGALITYKRVFPVDTSRPTAASTAISQKDGSFFLTQLPAGTYGICVELRGSKLLNPCDWSAAPIFSIGAGEVLPAVSIVMKEGVFLDVRLDDPSQLLPRPSKLNQGNEVIVAVWSDNGFHLVPLISQDAGGQSHSLVVPSGARLKVRIHSRSLPVNDGSGKAIADSTAPASFQAQKGAPPITIRFQIPGK